jgi:hypothetical protein
MSDTPKLVHLGAKDDFAGSIEGLRRNLPSFIKRAPSIAD